MRANTRRRLDASFAALLAMTEPVSSRANRLDIVAVGIDQERRVIGRAVILARTGAAIVAAAGLEALAVKAFHGVMILGAERDVDAVGLAALGEMQPERRRTLRPEAGIADRRSS